MRIKAPWLLWAGAALLAVALAWVWFVPSPDYLYLPNTASPLAPHVQVQDEKPETGMETGGIYFVDVTVRRATWAERLVAFLRPEGASLVPASHVVPPGSSFDQRHEDSLKEMARSEEVAAAVALKAAGYKVPSTPKGALVEAVAPDAPAIRLLHAGDVIVAARGRRTLTPDQLRRAFVGVKPGSTVSLGVRRDEKVITVSVQTVESPETPGRAIIGIRVAQAATIRLPRRVKIDLGSVGGPSAGLPFALDVYQELGADVDHGKRVVATGEIGLDGSVGPIGGIKQKTYGARRAHADVFLVPAGENATEARRYAGNLRIVPVHSFQQALSALKTLAEK